MGFRDLLENMERGKRVPADLWQLVFEWFDVSELEDFPIDLPRRELVRKFKIHQGLEDQLIGLYHKHISFTRRYIYNFALFPNEFQPSGHVPRGTRVIEICEDYNQVERYFDNEQPVIIEFK